MKHIHVFLSDILFKIFLLLLNKILTEYGTGIIFCLITIHRRENNNLVLSTDKVSLHDWHIEEKG